MEPYGKKISIIGLTASGSADDQAQFLKAGVNECLHKPVDISTLWSVIVKWIPDTQTATKPSPRTGTSRP
jgi:CheY-like chemotaxis protein